MAYFFSVSDKNLLANSIGFRLPLFCFGHSVARSPFVVTSVVRIFSLSELQCARQSNCVISLFIFLNSFVCSSVKTHSIRCSSSFLVLFVRADRFSIYFDKYCMAPKKDFYTFSFLGMFIFVISSTLSRSGMIPFWSILCPTQSASFLKSLNFPGVVCSLLPSIFSSFLLLQFRITTMLPLLTPKISIYHHAGCLHSSVLSIRSWKIVGTSASPEKPFRNR